MRLSSVQIFQQGISAILDQQARVQRSEQQLATGKRILTPSDDPSGSVQILNMTQNLERIDQYQRNGDLAQGQLGLEENVLTDVGNLLQRVRELVVQANNGTQTPETRKSIATEIAARLNELQALANTRDASGDYIFAGYQINTQPFSSQGTAVSYNGDSGQRFVQLGDSSQVAIRDSGADVFMAIPAGNGVFQVAAAAGNGGTAVVGSSSGNSQFVPDDYTITFSQVTPADPITYQITDGSAAIVASGNYVAGEGVNFAGVSLQFDGQPADGDSFDVTPAGRQSMFATLEAIVATLQGSDGTPANNARVHTALGQALNNLDQGIGHVLNIRADVGVRLNQVESQANINADFTLQLQETLSSVQDLDYAEAISQLNLQLTALQAAQQAYVKVQGLSLFNYL